MKRPIFPSCPPLGLYVVVPDVSWVERLTQWASEDPALRVGAIQLRDKHSQGKALQMAINGAVSCAQKINLPLYINDHWQSAIRAKAYGVHLGQEDLNALTDDDWQSLRQSGVRLGVSTHSEAELARALAVYPSYVAFGAIYSTTTKTMPTAPQGLDNLTKAMAHINAHRAEHPEAQNLRVVAIGGLFADTIPAVWACGIDGVAVVRAVTESADPRSAISQLNALMIQQD